MTYHRLTRKDNRHAAAIVLKSYRATVQTHRAHRAAGKPCDDDRALCERLGKQARDHLYGAREMLRLLYDDPGGA
jgi:hypothetical protein